MLVNYYESRVNTGFLSNTCISVIDIFRLCYAFNLNQVYILPAYATQLSISIISLTTTVRWLHDAGRGEIQMMSNFVANAAEHLSVFAVCCACVRASV